MNKKEMLPLAKDFVEYLHKKDSYAKLLEVDETFSICEVYQPCLLNSKILIQRIYSLCIIEKGEIDKIEKIHQAFIDYIHLSNCIKTIILSNSDFESGLVQYLKDRNIYCFKLTEKDFRKKNKIELFKRLEEILNIDLSSEKIKDIISDAKIGEQREDFPVDLHHLKHDILIATSNLLHQALHLIVELSMASSNEKYDLDSLTIESSFGKHFFSLTKRNRKTEIWERYIYPNKFSIMDLYRENTQLQDLLESKVLSEWSIKVRNAISEMYATIAKLGFSLLYSKEIINFISEFHDRLFALSNAGFIELLSEIFDSESYDNQILISRTLATLNPASPISRDIILKGAKSNLKPLSLFCISKIAAFGYKEGYPILKELSVDRRKIIRESALQALSIMNTRKDPFEGMVNKENVLVPEQTISRKSKKVKRAETTFPPNEISQLVNNAGEYYFYPGPHNTIININLMSNEIAVGTTHHPNGTRDVAVGNRFGLFSHIAGCLTGEITPDEENRCEMNEALITGADGKNIKIQLGESIKENESNDK